MENYTNFMNNLCNELNQMCPGKPYELNMKSNCSMLLNRINSSIMVGYHAHPLYSCYTPQRANSNNWWTCQQCGCNYFYTVPSFYCTACNYDLCQKCILSCKLFQIKCIIIP